MICVVWEVRCMCMCVVCRLNDDCSRVLVGYARGQLTMWDLTSGKLLRTITDAHSPGVAVLSVKFTDDKTVAVMSDSGGSVFRLEFKRLIGLRTCDSQCLFSGSRGEVSCCSYIRSNHYRCSWQLSVCETCEQWLKCHWIQGNAVLAPPIIEMQHSHTSNFVNRNARGPQPPVGGPKAVVQFPDLWFSALTSAVWAFLSQTNVRLPVVCVTQWWNVGLWPANFPYAALDLQLTGDHLCR